MAEATIVLVPDESEFMAAMSKLQVQFDGLAQIGGEAFARAVNRFQSIPQLFRVDAGDGVANRAGEARIVFKPSEALVELMAAMAAGNV